MPSPYPISQRFVTKPNTALYPSKRHVPVICKACRQSERGERSSGSIAFFFGLDADIRNVALERMRRIVKTCLRQLGFENVTEAEDGQAALEKLKTGEFELAISDWNMPNIMGIDLLRAVRADNKLKTTPFLMVTAQAQKENIIEAAKAGVSNYIIKPFAADSLQEKLDAIFAKK